MDLTVTVISFSFRKSLPVDESDHGGGYIFDCRALPNPGREERYKKKTGQDIEVIDYLKGQEVVDGYLRAVQAVLRISVDNYLERSFSNLLISFGCTGGQHRSVYCTEATGAWLKQEYSGRLLVKIVHRDCPKFEVP